MKPVIKHYLTMVLIYAEPKLGDSIFQVTLGWEHIGWQDPDFYGWRVRYSAREGGSIRQLGLDVLYESGTPREYFAQQIVGLEGRKTTCRLHVVSVSPPGLTESEPSNEISVVADFKDSVAPVMLRVTIVPKR